MRTTSKESWIRTLSVSLWLFAVVFALQLAAEPEWVNQHGARLVIGQNSFTRSNPVVTDPENPVSRRDVLGAAGGVAVGGNVLVVSEGNRIGATPINNRVLVYRDLAGFIPEPEAELPQNGFCPACVGLPDVVLGQPNFETPNQGTANGGMRAPSGIATDGQRLAVADTNNNRVLLWHSIPQTNGTPPDVILGQEGQATNVPRTTKDGMRGPQGVWIGDGGRLFVADTQNSRVLIWNTFPSTNGQGADIVVGQPDFVTRPEPDLTQANYLPNAQRLLNPASVQVRDGKMIVADLGFDRVLIYLSIPTQSNPPADVVIGQPDFETFSFVRGDDPGNTVDEEGNIVGSDGQILMDRSGLSLRRAVVALCELIGPFDDDGTLTPTDNRFPPVIRQDEEDADKFRYPKRCGSTLNFPRFALYDGTRLFISDSGNDRILIYNELPMENGAAADVVIGQPDFIALTDSDGAGNLRSPGALAHDGKNLYVADPLQRRVLVFTPGEKLIVRDGIRNGASFDIKAYGYIEWNNTATSAQTATVNISGQEYEIKDVPTGTTSAQLRDMFVERINAREDSLVIAHAANGPGTLSRAEFVFSGDVRGGDLITLRIRDREYSVTMVGPPDDPGPYLAIDRLLYVLNEAGGDPEVTVRRSPEDISTMEIVSNAVGTAGNGIPVSIIIPEGSPLIAQIVGDDGQPDDTASGTVRGGEFPSLAWLTAVAGGRPGNAVTIASSITGSTSGTLGITTSTSGARLDGASNASQLTPGAFATIFGEGFAEEEWHASSDDGSIPKELGGVRVYVNGLLAPLFYVSPNQINLQIPWEIIEDPGISNTGISTYVWRRMGDDSIVVSAARANEIVTAAPGLFALSGPEPRKAVAVHAQAVATGEVGIRAAADSDTDEDSNVVPAGITVTITVEGTAYAYTTQTGDTATSIRDALIALINAGDGDPLVTASPGQSSFFSALANVGFADTPLAGDVVTIYIGSPLPEGDEGTDEDGDGIEDSMRPYSYTVQADDNLATVKNLLIAQINSGRGDPDVNARDLSDIGLNALQVIARELGEQTNKIRFMVETSTGSGIRVETDQTEGFLEGGSTEPGVLLTARQSGKAGNGIRFSGSTSDESALTTSVRQLELCCGNVPFSPITDENPAIPGEIITLFASGLGLTSPLPWDEGLVSGQPTPSSPLFQAPFAFADFLSSVVGVDPKAAASVTFAGLMPGFVGIYQINLKLFEGLPENPETPIDIAQKSFISNIVTIPVKPLTPRDPVQ